MPVDGVAQPVHVYDLLKVKAAVAEVLQRAVLRCDAAGERVHQAGDDAVAQDMRQVLHVGRQLAAEQYVHDAAVHAPPVVDGAAVGAGFVARPAAVQHAAHDVFIQLAPVPERRGEVLQHAARADQKGAELAVGAPRHRRVAARDDLDALAGEDGQGFFLLRQAGPEQLDLDAGVGHARAQRKGVDAGRHAVAGVVGHIADAVAVGHGPGDGAGDELGLIHAGIVGADAGVGHLHRAVEDAHLGVFDGGAQRRAHQLGAGGKDDVGALGNGFFDEFVGVFAGRGVKVRHRFDLAGKGCVQLGAAELMLAGPGADLGRVLVHERHLEVGGRRRADAGQNALDERIGRLGFGRFGRFGADGDGVLGLQGQHVVPQRVELFVQLGGRVGGQLLPGVQAQQQQHDVAGRAAQRVAAAGLERLADPVVQRERIGAVLIAPHFFGAFAHGLLQARKAARLGEAQRVGVDERVVVHELVVQAHFGRVIVAGHDAGDVGRHAAGAKEFEHAGALVALLHIKAAHVLKAFQRLADAFVQVGGAEVGPLGGKLGAAAQQRHKVAGKRRRAPRRLGAHQQVQRHLDEAQRQLVFDLDVLQDIVQHRQKRRLTGRGLFAVVPLGQFLRFQVVFQCLCVRHGKVLLWQFIQIHIFCFVQSDYNTMRCKLQFFAVRALTRCARPWGRSSACARRRSVRPGRYPGRFARASPRCGCCSAPAPAS